MRRAELILAVMLGLAPMAASAQADYPTRPIRIVVPFPAAGPTDVAARLLAEALRPHLGQAVVVENRGGGGGVIGTELVAAAAPDGYTLLLSAPGSLVVSPSVKPVRYDVAKDLTPIAQVFRSAQLFVVHPRLGVKTFADFVAYAKSNPGKVNIGSAGLGTLPHLSLELLRRETGVDVAHIPYRGTGSAVADLIGGQIDAMFGDIAVLKPIALAGTVAPLAITSRDRSPSFPDLLTMREAGFPKLEVEGWAGLLAPSGLPPVVLERLDSAVQKALNDPKFLDGGAKQDWGDLDTSRERFATYLAEEAARWSALIKSAGIKIE
jgi:tripartite-type tricarboxylate transporter receptor subunit TctC